MSIEKGFLSNLLNFIYINNLILILKEGKKKMKISYLLLFTILLTGIAHGSWYNKYYVNSQGLWEISSMTENPSLLLYLGMSEEDAKKALKREPLHSNSGNSGVDKILSYNDMLKEPSGFDLYIKNNRLVALCIYTNNIPDNNGIAAGENKSKLIKTWGDSYKKETIRGHGSGITYEATMGNIFFCMDSSDRIKEIIIYLKGQW
jgi:hypothetical protein